MPVHLYATVVTLPELHAPHGVVVDDPGLRRHAEALVDAVMGGGTRRMTATRYALYRHLQRVRHHVVVETTPEALTEWCIEANAVRRLEDGSFADAAGEILCAAETGDPADGARVPYPMDAKVRKAVSDASLAGRKIRVPETLPPVVGEPEVMLRAADDVRARAEALFVCAVRAESLLTNRPIASEAILARLPRADAALSPRERRFIDAASPHPQESTQQLWGYEASAALMWALGAMPLPFPEHKVDVPTLTGPMMAHPDAPPTLRPTGEILDALDLHFRLHWATTDANQQRKAVPGVVDGVVAERHRALNWLTRFEDADWDDVDTPT